MASARAFLRQHPLLRDTLLWSAPALLLGGALRLLLLSYLPYALWGADSRSHFAFAQHLIGEHVFHMEEKRRYLYPLLMAPLALLPGAPLRWLPLFQHALGLASLAPLAYTIRRTLIGWRWWIIPLTVFYAALPVTLLFEHEMVGECLLFNAWLWAFAGWQAWTAQSNPRRARRLSWFFWIPFAALILTKPAARFAWPGLLLALFGLPAVRARVRGWSLVALAALMLVTPFVGSRKLGALMLYTATFPLTQLETPKLAPYKAEVRSMVEELQPRLDEYYLLDDPPFNFVFRGQVDETRPAWQSLVRDHPKERAPVCLALALEGIRARPFRFLGFGLQRLVASANLSCSDYQPFTGEYFRKRERLYYEEAGRLEESGFRLAFGLPLHGALPPYESFAGRLEPEPGSGRAWLFQGIERQVAKFDLVTLPGGPLEQCGIARARPTWAGWLVLAGAALSFLPAYRRGLGMWTLISASYLFGVFTFSEVNYRYFAPAWPVLLLLLVLPGDLAWRVWQGRRLAPAEVR